MTFFAVERSIGSFYTGGVSVVRNDKIIYSAIEDSLLETDLASGLTTKHLISSGDSIVTFAVSQDASLAVIITKSSLMWIFDLLSKEVIKSWKSHSATPLAVCLDPENEIVAVGFSDRSLRIWNLECGSCLTSIKGFSSLASCLSIPYPDDSKLFCGTSEGKIFCFNYRNGKCLGKTEAHSSVVTGLSFSKDPKVPHPYFVSFSRDKVVCLWKLSFDADSAFKAVKSLMVFESLESGFLISSNHENEKDDDQIVVAVGGENGAVSLWNLSQSKLISKESPRQGQSIIQLHEIEGGILSISSEHSIRSLSFPSLSCNFTLQGHKGEITDLSCLGSNLIVATNDEKIKVYQRSNLFHSQELSGHTAIVLCLDSINWKDQDFVLSGAKDHTVRLWRRLPGKEENFKLLFTCEGHTEAVGAVAFCKSSNDQGLTFLSASEDKTIKAWRLLQSSSLNDDDGQCSVSSLFTIKAHDKDINSLAVASDDQYFASASQDKSAKIWNFKGQLIATLSGHKRGVSCVQFYSSNAAAASEGRNHCQFIATSSADKTIKIWSGSSFECLKTLEGHTSSILKIAFLGGNADAAASSKHSESVELISISSDGLVKIWNLKNSECIATYDEHTDKIWALCLGKCDNNVSENSFQSDEMLYTGGADAEIKAWKNITREKQEQEILHQNQIIETNQKLDNLLWKQDYKNAVALAFQLQQPKKLLFILKELLMQAHSPPEMLSEALEAIPMQDLSRLIGYCKEWNTSFHNSSVAQMILQALVKKYHWEVLLEQVPEMHKNIEALLPYTQRHIQRLDEMKKRVMLVDYIILTL